LENMGGLKTGTRRDNEPVVKLQREVLKIQGVVKVTFTQKGGLSSLKCAGEKGKMKLKKSVGGKTGKI